MVGISAKAYCIGKIVRKVCHKLITRKLQIRIRKACETEALIYRILGHHHRIVNCLFYQTRNNHVELEYYSCDNLKSRKNLPALVVHTTHSGSGRHYVRGVCA
jgi:hypothetical protein